MKVLNKFLLTSPKGLFWNVYTSEEPEELFQGVPILLNNMKDYSTPTTKYLYMAFGPLTNADGCQRLPQYTKPVNYPIKEIVQKPKITYYEEIVE